MKLFNILRYTVLILTFLDINGYIIPTAYKNGGTQGVAKKQALKLRNSYNNNMICNEKFIYMKYLIGIRNFKRFIALSKIITLLIYRILSILLTILIPHKSQILMKIIIITPYSLITRCFIILHFSLTIQILTIITRKLQKILYYLMCI